MHPAADYRLSSVKITLSDIVEFISGKFLDPEVEKEVNSRFCRYGMCYISTLLFFFGTFTFHQ